MTTTDPALRVVEQDPQETSAVQDTVHVPKDPFLKRATAAIGETLSKIRKDERVRLTLGWGMFFYGHLLIPGLDEQAKLGPVPYPAAIEVLNDWSNRPDHIAAGFGEPDIESLGQDHGSRIIVEFLDTDEDLSRVPEMYYAPSFSGVSKGPNYLKPGMWKLELGREDVEIGNFMNACDYVRSNQGAVRGDDKPTRESFVGKTIKAFTTDEAVADAGIRLRLSENDIVSVCTLPVDGERPTLPVGDIYFWMD